MAEFLKSGLTNLRGKKIGDLLVLRRIPGKRKWRVLCEAEGCGKELNVDHNRLIHKKTPKRHCGCRNKGIQTRYSKEYHAWHDARNRCHNPQHPSYPRYGAKGIFMCDEWRGSFECFLRDVGPRPKGGSLDRIDPRGPYAPMHDGKPQIRWADVKTQNRNKKSTKYITHPKTGEQIAAADLADELDMTYQQLRNKMIAEGKW